MVVANSPQPEPIYTVTFVPNGGLPEPQSVQVQNGKTMSAPAAMTRAGYDFEGWYSDSGLNNKFNFASPITQSITLYARWIELHTVTFVPNGGTPEPQSVQVQNGKTVSAPAGMTRAGYDLEGWYSDSGLNNKFNFASPITQNITLYARWIFATVRPQDLGWTTRTWSGSSTFTVSGNIFTINSNNRVDDAYFSRVFQVKPKTQYVFSADVITTAGQTSETSGSDIRANIGVPSGYYYVAYNHNQGGWQTLEFAIDSENNTEITLALRQGHFGSTVNGITQFKNIKLQERVVVSRDSNWNFLCLILRNVDANITVDGIPRNVKISMDNATVDAAELQLNRFKTAIETMTNRQMTANLDIHVVDTPVTRLTDIGSLGFWAGSGDIEHILKPYFESKSYDHVITMTQFDRSDAISAPRGWAGLNSMGPIGSLGGKFYDAAYLQIAMTVWGGLAWYYDPNVPAQFYVSGMVHEFAHTVQWISIRKGIEVPDLHDAWPYGYAENDDNLGEWYKWLRDYLTCNINSIDPPARKIGCTQESYMFDRYGPGITIYVINELVA